MSHEILIVDDERDICRLIADILEDEGYASHAVQTAEVAMQALKGRCPNLVILDVWLEGSRIDGLQLLRAIRQQWSEVPVIVISGHGNVEMAVTALKQGAYDFIEKPFKTDRLLATVARALDTARLERENKELRLRAGEPLDMLGSSSTITHVRQAIERVAPTGSRVFITGAPGTGKEVAARLLHKKSRRADGPFVALNCALMHPDRIDIELFGTEKALDGQKRKIGVLERAHGGTLLLDEICDMPLETQGKIVRALQDQTFERVGGVNRIKVDVRVVASTNRDPEEEMNAGRLRRDLFYRLNVVPIHIPDLSERREDISELAQSFMQLAAEATGLKTRDIGPDAIAALQSYSWPGNVRQLRNVVDWLLIMGGGGEGAAIRADMLPPDIGSIAPEVLRWDKSGEIMSMPLREARETFERDYLVAQVNRFGGNISRTASFVGMERSALHRKLKALGVHGNTATSCTANTPSEEEETPPMRLAAGD